MISPEDFYAGLAASGVNFAVGVPDSLLKNFCGYASAELPHGKHMIAANEGAAVAIAAGVHLSTGGIPLVYMQNSGLGNTINPLLSLADPEVYGIPMVLLIGWRGEPGVRDEPQHVKQGRVSPALLEASGIPFEVITGDPAEAEEIARRAPERARKQCGPVAILVKKGAFAKPREKQQPATKIQGLPAREETIGLIASSLPDNAVIVSTTGMISRELYEYREKNNQDHSRDFLTVGSMGHSSQIALGIALGNNTSPIVCLDGDGAALMHMGGLALIGTSGARNYIHILLNNGVHDSVGAQPTVGFDVNFVDIARACGYPQTLGPLSEGTQITNTLRQLLDSDGPAFLEIRVRPGARPDLGRPAESPAENKQRFIERLRRTE